MKTKLLLIYTASIFLMMSGIILISCEPINSDHLMRWFLIVKGSGIALTYISYKLFKKYLIKNIKLNN